MKSMNWKTLFALVAVLGLALALNACGVEDEDTAPGPACTDCDDPEPTPTPKPVCGDGTCESGETAETCEADCKVEPTPIPADTLACPFKTDGPFNWNVAGKYISGATKGEIRFFTKMTNGTYPNPVVLDSNESGYLGMEYAVAAGTYRFSYLGYQYASECSGSDCPVAWAQYGSLETLQKLTQECRAYIDCNWWSASEAKMVETECAECALKVKVAANGTITGAGNMANLANLK